MPTLHAFLLLLLLLHTDLTAALRPGAAAATAARLCSRRGAAAAGPRCCAVSDPDAGPFGAELWSELNEVAEEEAEELGLSIHELAFRKGKLNVLVQGAGLDELQQINLRLSAFLDGQEETDALPPYMLEVSSPGVSSNLQSDPDFAAFKGFPVTVSLSEEYKKKTTFSGTLVGRDDEHVTINLKGRVTKIPRELVLSVVLPKAETEARDPYNGA